MLFVCRVGLCKDIRSSAGHRIVRIRGTKKALFLMKKQSFYTYNECLGIIPKELDVFNLLKNKITSFKTVNLFYHNALISDLRNEFDSHQTNIFFRIFVRSKFFQRIFYRFIFCFAKVFKHFVLVILIENLVDIIIDI